jgi:hypothetical protein
MLTTEELVELADKRPGYSIVNYRPVALPVFRLQVLVTLLEQQPIGPIEQFILKAIRLSINNAEGISQFLGLPEIVVNKQLAASLFEGTLACVKDAPANFLLTKSGETRLEECAKNDVTKEVIPFYVDGVTREVIAVRKENLYKSSELKTVGISSLPPSPKRPPMIRELDVGQMNTILKANIGWKSISRRIIKVDALVDKTYLHFRPAIALAYKSSNGRSVSIGFMIEGLVSELHEKMFMNSGDATKSTVFKDIFDVRRRRLDIQQMFRQAQDIFALPGGMMDLDESPRRRPRLTLPSKRDATKLRVDESAVRIVGAYEHVPLLEKGLAESKQRLLVVSPRIRSGVVNDFIIRQLVDRLQAGVQITIISGLGVDRGESVEDRAAVEKLEALGQRYSNFLFYRRNAVAKSLIVDSEYAVITTFPWLSFKGDPGQAFREEQGLCITDSSAVEAYYHYSIGEIRSST